ncbi:MAG: ATP-binding cassette domain-containing protein [Acetobacteraceae bacterium]|nr:ATP-binding cassette domain-containing protein [Acetobacteraceae bacterium]
MNAINPATHGIGMSVRGLRKRFGALDVLRGIDLDVAAGEFVAIIGRSGCGKSTLLRILAGLDQASEGTLRLGAGDSRARLMFQEPRLLPWAHVIDNVEIGLGADGGKDHVRAVAALRAVGLTDKAKAWPGTLSGGQKQRVALARALVSRPRFLALDEPLGALDALTRIEMQGLLEQVWQEQRFTAVLVTHDVSEALLLADRVVMIESGEVAMDIPISLPRPRRHGSAELGALEDVILDRLLGSAPARSV